MKRKIADQDDETKIYKTKKRKTTKHRVAIPTPVRRKLPQTSTCSYENCLSHASFGITDTSARFCSAHMPEGSTNVVLPKCSKPGCAKNAYYSNENRTVPFVCRRHATTGMINITTRNVVIKCSRPQCDKKALYNFPGNSTPIYCCPHSAEGMTNVKYRKCAILNCRDNAITANPSGFSLFCTRHIMSYFGQH